MTTDKTFADLGVGKHIVSVLAARGITHPFPIQVETLPDTLAGRDVLGRGKTGSGKTLAFSIPLVSRLSHGNRRPARPSGLVLAPTRELATQITATLEPLAAACGLRVTTIFGGVSQTRQVAALKSGVDIVVACPGRLEDLMKQRLISLDAIEITVIDEADHMADLGFLPGVTRILAATPNGGQRLLFSATLDNGVDKLVTRFLRDAVSHSVDEANSPVSEMTHHVFHVDSAQAKRNWYTGSPPAPDAGSCSCAPSTKRESSPSSSPNRAFPQSTCTATCLSRLGSATWRGSPRAAPGCWWRPISPRVACTSTRSSLLCTSIRRASTSPTCTGPGAPRGPGAPVTSSRWCCPSSAKTPGSCCARPASKSLPSR